MLDQKLTINRYLEDASYMNRDNGDWRTNELRVQYVVLDDTTKAAGHDVMADHITIASPNVSRKSMTTWENVSHGGEAGAAAYELKLKCLAVLAASLWCRSNQKVISTSGDWQSWTDLAGDCASLLENICVTE